MKLFYHYQNLQMSESLSPFSVAEASIVWREEMGKLLRAAYLQSFAPDRIDTCRYKFPDFADWWATLSDEQKIRVKGVLAAFIS